jgi:hypothetical protein
MDLDTCWVCEKRRPCEEHHLVPPGHEPPESLKVPLCVSCHDAVFPTRVGVNQRVILREIL